MKANNKAREDSGIVNVVSMLLILAVVIPALTMILASFSNLAFKQIDVMNSTANILDDSLARIESYWGNDLRSGNGFIFKNYYNKSGTLHTCYLIMHRHELDNNFSAYYPAERLPVEFENDSLKVKFKVNIIETYFNFTFPDVYLIYNDTGVYNNTVAEEPGELLPGWTCVAVNVSMVRVLEIEKRI